VTAHLLDVNVLLALADPAHLHHDAAHRWFERNAAVGWATCPITENGFVRVASHPEYPNRPGDAQVVLELLRGACARDDHRFWPDSISLREAVVRDRALTHGQLTDVYLLALAVAHGGRLATFDRRIPVEVVDGGREALVVIPG
jgi:toxin-antitoxin system PIN domain toxin